jgi:hypothetical protein
VLDRRRRHTRFEQLDRPTVHDLVAGRGGHGNGPAEMIGDPEAHVADPPFGASGGTGSRSASSMPVMRIRILLVVVGMAIAMPPAAAAAPGGVARYAPCPVPTDDPARYAGPDAPFRCHSAITDPNGLVVILREGRAAAAGPGPFGRRHAAVDRGVSDGVIARVVSTVLPIAGEQRRLHYVEEVRVGEETAEIWVVVDRAPSRQAPDTRPFGVITAFCRGEASAEPARCPSWVSAG